MAEKPIVSAAPADALSARAVSRLEAARAVADAVLFEGYLLYPYRASATKNKYRFQFGVLFDPAYVASHEDERSKAHCECLIEPRQGSSLAVEVRFLQLFRRWPEVEVEGAFVAAERVELADRTLVPFEDAVVRSVVVGITLRPPASAGDAAKSTPGGSVPAGAGDGGFARDFHFPAEFSRELMPETDSAGHRVSLAKQSEELAGRIEGRLVELDTPSPMLRLELTVANCAGGRHPDRDRSEALLEALIGCHAILAVEAARLVSLLDPPEWVKPWVKQCHQDGWFPVLAGPAGSEEAMLASPILLYDHPVLAPESPTAMYDGTEIDEILALRTHALTEEEKREVRGTDARAAQLLEDVDGLPKEIWERLHGTIRYLKEVTSEGSPAATVLAPPPKPEQPWWDPGADPNASPETDCVVVGGCEVRKGSYVTLAPRPGADAQDLFVTGRLAVVQAVFFDLEGQAHLAVTLEDDPGVDLQIQEGRFLYFRPDEVLPLADFTSPAGEPLADESGGVR